MPTVLYADVVNGNDWSGSGGADSGGYTGALAAWAVGTSYVTGNRIYYGTAPTRTIWRALRNNTGVTPVEGADWTLIADGSTAKPFKAQDATAGLTAGDECRIAKSTAPTAISQNLTWTAGSTSVVCTGSDIRAEVAVGDFIGKTTAGAPGSTEGYYRVTSTAYSGGNTTITLTYKYCGTTGTAASQKLVTSSTGTHAATDTSIFNVQASGTSSGNIVISGGWDLSTAQQTGQTWLQPSNSQGRGMALTSISYVTIQDIGFVYYTTGIYGTPAVNCLVQRCTGLYSGSNSGSNIVFANGSSGVTVQSCSMFGASNSIGLDFNGAFGGCIGITCYVGACQYGYRSGTSCEFRGCTAIYAGTQGFRCTSSWSRVIGCSTIACAYGFYFDVTYGHICNNIVFSGNTSGDANTSNITRYPSLIVAQFQNWNASDGDHRTLWPGGWSQRSATAGDWRTAAPGVKFSPNTAYAVGAAYCAEEFVAVANADTAYTLSIYLKSAGSFNGAVYLEAYNSSGKLVTGPTLASVTTDWAQYSINVAAVDQLDGDTLTLMVKVYGTVGTVHADDFAIAAT